MPCGRIWSAFTGVDGYETDEVTIRTMAHQDAVRAMAILKQNQRRQLMGLPPMSTLGNNDNSNGGTVDGPKFVPNIYQIGDATGLKDQGKNFIVRVGLGDPLWWCKDPRHPKKVPLPPNSHPRIELAFNAREINVSLTDKGTLDEPDDVLLWDANFAKDHSMREITPEMMPDGGDMISMQRICPKPGKVHRLELEVQGRDHRADPKQDEDRGLVETVQFEAEILPPGAQPHNRRAGASPGGDDGDNERESGGVRPEYMIKGPFVEVAPDALLSALLLPPPCLKDQLLSRRQQMRKRLAERHMIRSSTFL